MAIIRREGPILTIFLGKNVVSVFGKKPISRSVVFFPEVGAAESHVGTHYVARHPDDFIPTVMQRIAKVVVERRQNLDLYTMSEYLVSHIAQEVGRKRARDT